MFKSRIFSAWFFSALVAWGVLFASLSDVKFLAEHWYYPVMMVLGAFVAGFTPEGGGAVAFPVLNIFLHVDRVLARDFSMMIQSIGMSSASIFILSDKQTVLKNYKPLWVFVPICFGGFVAGMLGLQHMPVFVIQALFLSLSTTFVAAYYFSYHRGGEEEVFANSNWEKFALGLTLLLVVFYFWLKHVSLPVLPKNSAAAKPNDQAASRS